MYFHFNSKALGWNLIFLKVLTLSFLEVDLVYPYVHKSSKLDDLVGDLRSLHHHLHWLVPLPTNWDVLFRGIRSIHSKIQTDSPTTPSVHSHSFLSIERMLGSLRWRVGGWRSDRVFISSSNSISQSTYDSPFQFSYKGTYQCHLCIQTQTLQMLTRSFGSFQSCGNGGRRRPLEDRGRHRLGRRGRRLSNEKP